MDLPHDEKVAALTDPDTRRHLETRAASPDAGVFSRLTGWGLYRIGDTYSPENEGLKGRLVGDIARERGVRDFYALLDIVLADDLRTVLWPGPTDDDPASWLMRQAVWDHDHVMIGGSDAGAHLDMFGTFNFTTRLIGGAVREHGLIDLEEAVHLLTARQADLYGMVDRGRIAEDAHADLVVFDEHSIGSDPLSLRADLPGGAARLYAGSSGIDEVLCAGVPVVSGGDFTEARPGRVLRSGTDTR